MDTLNQSSYVTVHVIMLFVTLTNVFVAEGRIVCHFCNSKEGNCSFSSLSGTRQSSCARGYAYCSIYRKVFPNGTTAQIVRSCDRHCDRPQTKWTVGSHQPTTHCKRCCKSDFCNDFEADPCSAPTSLVSTTLALPLFLTFGLCVS